MIAKTIAVQKTTKTTTSVIAPLRRKATKKTAISTTITGCNWNGLDKTQQYSDALSQKKKLLEGFD
jgi:hypothetical protein